MTRPIHDSKSEYTLPALLAACRPLSESLPYPLLIIGPDGAVHDVNRAAAALLGQSSTTVRGRPIFELLQFTLPATHRSLVRRVVEERIPRAIVDTLRCNDINCICEVQYTLWESQVSEPPLVLCTLLKVEAADAGVARQAHGERALAILHEANRTFQLHEDEEKIYHELCRIAVDTCGYRMAWIGLMEQAKGQWLRAVAWHGEGADYIENVKVSWHEGPYGRGPGGIAIRSGRPAVVNEVQIDPAFAPWREMAEIHGFSSMIALPVTVEEEVVGALGIYASASHAFDSLTVGILEELMRALDIRLSLLRARQREAAVEAKRTIEEERLAVVLESTVDGFWDWNVATDEVFFSSGWLSSAGYRRENTQPHIVFWNELIHPDDLPRVQAALEAHFENHTASYECEYRLRLPDGNYGWRYDHGRVIQRDDDGRPLRMVGVDTEITDLKRAQLEIERQHDLLRTVIDLIPDPIYIKDREGRKRLVNRADLTYMGVADLSEALGQSDDAIYAPELARQFAEQDREVLERGKPVLNRQEQILLNGEPRWLLTSKVPLRDRAGDIVGLVGIGRDITDRLQAQEQLLQREETFRALVDNTPDIIVRFDHSGVIKFANRALLELLEQDLGGVVGRSIAQFDVPPQFAQATDKTIRDVFTSGASASLIADGFSWRGIRRHLSVQFVPEFATTGAVDTVLAIGHDITDLYAAQVKLQEMNQMLEQHVASRTQELATANQDLAHVTQLQEAILDSANYAILSTNTQGLIRTFNATAVEWLGYAADEVIGHLTPLDFFLTDQPENGTAEHDGQIVDHRAAFANLVARSHAQQFDERECFCVRRGADQFPAQLSITALRSNGTVTGYLFIAGDLTVRKQQESELRVAYRALEKASRLKDDFLANMSHELRTPLTGILGLSEALQLQVYGELNERQLKSLRSIESSGRHLLELINDILDLSRIEAGHLELRLSITSADAVCRTSFQIVEALAAKKNQILSYSGPAQEIDLCIDQRRVRQVIVNLLSNAIKFTPEAGSIGLDVLGDEENGLVHFIVWDTGIGIANENLSRIFEPFMQLDSSLSRHHSGSGLGLALVKRIVELHGGTISADSKLGHGSRFDLTLPWNPQDLSACAQVAF